MFWYAVGSAIISALLFVLFGKLDTRVGYDSPFAFLCKLAAMCLGLSLIVIFLFVWDIVLLFLLLLFLAGMCYTVPHAGDYGLRKIWGP